MSNIEITRHIPASPARVWAAFADFGGIHKFHPFVETSPMLSQNASGLGAERRCEFYDGNSVCERVVGVEEGTSMTIDIYEGSMPLERAEARIHLEPADGGTRVRFVMDYTVKWGPIGALMDVMMMRRKMRGMLGKVLAGLETHLETGAAIGQGGLPEMTVAMA